MTTRVFGQISTVILASCIAGCVSGTPSETSKEVDVYASERDTFNGALNKPVSAPLARLPKGTPVVVVEDRYGKDYWACRISTPDGRKGWVLCTALNYKRSAGT